MNDLNLILLGIPMTEKMHSDYVNIMKRIQNNRHEKATHERRASASH